MDFSNAKKYMGGLDLGLSRSRLPDWMGLDCVELRSRRNTEGENLADKGDSGSRKIRLLFGLLSLSSSCVRERKPGEKMAAENIWGPEARENRI